MKVTESGMSTETNTLHPSKARSPMDVTDSEIVTELQLAKTLATPMDSTASGIVAETNPEQSKKARSPMEVTESGIITDVNMLHL
jgi:hypothetical protein